MEFKRSALRAEQWTLTYNHELLPGSFFSWWPPLVLYDITNGKFVLASWGRTLTLPLSIQNTWAKNLVLLSFYIMKLHWRTKNTNPKKLAEKLLRSLNTTFCVHIFILQCTYVYFFSQVEDLSISHRSHREGILFTFTSHPYLLLIR